jgi:hypothetical protein
MPYRQKDILFGMSRFPQTNYQTPITPSATAPTSHVQLLANREQTNFTYSMELLDNSNQATGTDEPTDVYLGRHNAEGAIETEMDVENVVRQHHGHFGQTAGSEIAAAAGGDPAVQEYVIDRMEMSASLQLPAYEFFELIPGSKKDRRYLSMLSRELVLTFVNEKAEQRMSLAQRYVGSGRTIAPSGLIWQPTSGYHVQKATNRRYFSGLHARLSIGDYNGSGSGQNVVNYHDCRLRRATVTYTNEFLDAEAICPGAGLYYFKIDGEIWKATTAFALNDLVVWSGRIYKVTTGGTTGSSAPTHTTGSAANGSATLQFLNFGGIARWGASTPVLAGDFYIANDRLYYVTASGTTGSSAPTHVTGSAADGTATVEYRGRASLMGAVSGQLYLVSRSIRPEFVVEAEANSRFIEDMQMQRPLDIVCGAVGSELRTGYYDQLLHHFYKTTYEAVSEDFINGLFRYTLRPRVQLDQAQNKVVQVIARNTTPDSEYFV